jgi:nucleoid-associated protein YgaU
MNDPAVKLALAFSIILGGFLAAIAFRPNPTAGTNPPTHSWAELMALRNRRLPERNNSAPQAQSAASPIPQPLAESNPPREPKVLAPLDNPPPVPALSSKYPGDGVPSSTGWGMPIVPVREGNQPEKGPRSHTIVDGDTLASLAKQYYGSPDRAMEIFAANREILQDPKLLPIGAEVKIP